jgi:hypothetical protein
VIAAVAAVAVTPAVAAHRLLLTAHDFPSSWTAAPPAKTQPVLTCIASARAPVKAAAVASSPSFSASTSGPFVRQTAWIYRTGAQATNVWKLAAPQLRRCMVEAVKSGSTSSVTFTVKHVATLALPKLAPRIVGYRVVATATSTGQTVDTYYDLIVLARGTGITELSLARLSSPVERSLELRLARVTAQRLRRS